jgi:KDO2-lipid IV(A) lauroyltransferase
MHDDTIYRLYRSGGAALSALPEPLARALGALGGQVMWLSARRRAAVHFNLDHVLQAAPPKEIHRVVRRAFSSYGIYWAEAARLKKLERGAVARRFSIDGLAHIEDAEAAGNGLILALPHLGCWEFGAKLLADRGIHLTTVAEVLQPAALFDWFVDERERIGLHVLPLAKSATRSLLATLQSGKEVALVADRDISHDGTEVEFFSAPTRLPTGPALLALRSGAPLIPCAIYHQPHGQHHLAVLPPIDTSRSGQWRDDVQRVTTDLASAFEGLIAEAPEQWHVFQPNWN